MNSNVKRAYARRFSRVTRPKPLHLTERDARVLYALAQLRLLSVEQIRRLVFRTGDAQHPLVSLSRVLRRLRALYDHGFVQRVPLAPDPRCGTPSLAYTLTKRGVAALGERGISAEAFRSTDGGVRFARHRLVLNDCYITLREATVGTAHGIVNWRDEDQLKLPGDNRWGKVERVGIRHPVTSEQREVPFLPDAYFEVTVAEGKSYAFFLEVDLSTHALSKWRERAVLYTTYADAQRGLFQRRFGRRTFRVLVVTPPDFRRRSRCDNVLRAIERTVGASDMFLGTTLEDWTAERVLGRVWRQAGSQSRRSLLDNPGGGIGSMPGS